MRLFRFGFLILSVSALNAYAASILGSAANYAVLGASTVTNTGTTTLGGNLGVSPGSALTGTGTIVFTGGSVIDNGDAATAQGDASTAFTSLGASSLVSAALSGTPSSGGNNLTGFDLGGLTLSAGTGGTTTVVSNGVSTAETIFAFSTSAQLTGALTLNFGGASGQTIVIDTGTTLTTAAGPNGGPLDSSVLIENAGSNDNVVWLVGSSATIGTYTSFAGNITAGTGSVGMFTGATDGCGSVISLIAAVTLQGNTISTGCTITGGSTTTGGTVTPTTGPVTSQVTVPEGGSTLLYLCLFLLPIGGMQAFRGRRSA